jgi:hypothetical protein
MRYALFENVRFPYLTFAELEEAAMEVLVPRELLVDSLMVRMASYEVPNYLAGLVLPQRLQKRAAYGKRLFKFSGVDFDDQGVLYYIGTKGGTAKWRNPCLVENAVTVTSSSQEKGDPISIIGRKPTEFWTMDIPSSWVCVDLGISRRLLITHYTLRHGGNSKRDFLRTWVLQASDDCKREIET